MMLFAYDGANVWLRVPAPVTVAVHGVKGAPVYVVAAGDLSHAMVVNDGALLMCHGIDAELS